MGTLIFVASLASAQMVDPLEPEEVPDDPRSVKHVAAKTIAGCTTCTVCSTACCGVFTGMIGGSVLVYSVYPALNLVGLALGAGLCAAGTLLGASVLVIPGAGIPLSMAGWWDWKVAWFVVMWMMEIMSVLL